VNSADDKHAEARAASRDRVKKAIKEDEDAAKAAIKISTREKMLERVSRAAALFEARWTMGALLRAEPDLHEAIEDQLGRFHESLVTGQDKEIVTHGEAMCRGWAAAIIAMEKSGIAEDAVHIGEFGDVIVAIGRAQRCPEWLRERYGEGLTYLRPREVAAMYFQVRAAQEVKRLWPDAEIVEVRGKEAAGG
jgi:hypothetical protein